MSIPHLETFRTLLDEDSTSPADCDPALPRLSGIKAVIFDVYGTLYTSGRYRENLQGGSTIEEKLRAILLTHQIEPPNDHHPLGANLLKLIQREHKAARARGVPYPEVEIRSIWSQLLDCPIDHVIEDIAIRYECMTNPVWPMPGASELLASLRHRQLLLGIVSNAQFYTPLLFPALLQYSLPDLGFNEALCVFSYQHAAAKPGGELYRILSERLSQHGILPQQVLYIGNDASKDIHPASEAGFRTALFAGDQNSLRLPSRKSELLPPDAVLTHLLQVPRLLGERP